MRNHYVPKLILKHFSTENKINYVDIYNKNIELRNIKTTFANSDFYEDELEKKLCKNIEAKFGDVLNNKILNVKNNIKLTRDEVLIIKKFLLSTIYRRKISEEKAQKRQKFYANDFLNQLNNLLANEINEDAFEVLELLAEPDNLENIYNKLVKKYPLANSSFISIYNSYLCIWDISNTGQEFVTTDLNYTLNLHSYNKLGLNKTLYLMENCKNLQVHMQIAPSATNNEDYIIFPVSKTRAIVAVNTFYKLFARNSEVYGCMNLNDLTINKCFGFGDATLIEAPKIRNGIYNYNIQKLDKEGAIFNNMLLLNEADKFIGFNDFEKIKNSIEKFQSIEGVKHDYSFLLK